LVAAEGAGERNRLAAEKRFRQLIKLAKLPSPDPNARVGRFVVDFLWPEHRVVVELDGFATHNRRGAFEGDRARDGDLLAVGYRVIRVTWRQLTREPCAVVARVAAILALSGRELALR
jgi:very-short-patch-repair endonuclease